MKPILIASKARPDSKLLKQLDTDRARATVFVEPQDLPDYLEAFPHLVIVDIGENNKGIVFVRQLILDYARNNNFDWYWTLDDDITGFYEAIDGKNVKKSMYFVLEIAELIIMAFKDAAIGGLEYQQFAWASKKEVKFNSYCEVATLINVEKTKLCNYRNDGKEDRDFVLQALSLGYKSVRCGKLSFACPKNSSNKGGLYEYYKNDKEISASNKMVQMWPDVCTHLTKKDGRPDVRIAWHKFKNN